ncbi:MAG: aminodeoxychorismate synthase component I [Anaerolineae bacterium]|nr:aminodeoxychorismate synthase component I [Anaerolineae bacterium]
MHHPGSHEIVLHDAHERRWLHFRRPRHVYQTTNLAAVLPLLETVEARVEAEGLWAAGFLAYEAAPAFDRALQTHPPSPGFPLLWFGLYPAPAAINLDAAPYPPSPPLSWQPSVTPAAYEAAIATIKEQIAAGLTYQVNYSYRLRAPFTGDPWRYFLELVAAQEPGFGAYVDTGRFAICSASPELFVQRDGETVTSRPMKGTAPRGLTWEDDCRQATWLHQSEKNRAENVMIVDMIRNDFGRVARPGSVAVPALFTVERYPTVWQMTSTVTAATDVSHSRLLQAMFPCASITGAPKRSTMNIIAELEPDPRYIYTGSIGYMAPGRRLQLNVAIRTVLVDRESGKGEYGVGGGIVWDSTPGEELAETAHKARVLTTRRPPFQLLETVRWEPDTGYFLLEDHLRRLQRSADYFGFTFKLKAITTALDRQATGFPATPQRVRLFLARSGEMTVENYRYRPDPSPRRVCLAPQPINRDDPFLYHKTTHRAVYENALAACPGYDDVLFWNEDGELTESSRANIILELDGERVTPPVRSGLLPGIYRGWLLREGHVREQVVRLSDLERCTHLWLVNALRGEQTAVLEHANSKSGDQPDV